MRRRIGLGAVALAGVVVLLITQIGAASTPRAHAATVNTYRVPGVIHDGFLETMFSCTNGGTVAASTTVSLFKEDGTADGTATLSIPAKGTTNFASNPFAGLTVDAIISAESFSKGSATISAPTGVFCAAFVADAVAEHEPRVMMSLPVIKGTTQKGV